MLWQMVIKEEREEAAIMAIIESKREDGIADSAIIQKLMSKFRLSEEEAKEAIADYDVSLQHA